MNEIFPLLWQGTEPTDPKNVGPFQVLVLAWGEQQPAWQRFNDNGYEVIAVAMQDDQKTLRSIDIDLAKAAASMIAKRILAGKSVLVTCGHGRNRSGLINALVLREIFPRWSGKLCMAKVREKRPGALHNPAFAQYLESLE